MVGKKKGGGGGSSGKNLKPGIDPGNFRVMSE